jgi:formate hydrogenlyase subunit 6/NADH:ubiquinone oxidoreductase subunit I
MANPFNLPMMRRSLRNLLSRPATRRYPSEVRPHFAGTRGTLEFDPDTCVFCGLCARRCPTVALTCSREDRFFAIEQLRCIACGVCIDLCNKDSLRMSEDAPHVHLHTGAASGAPRPGHQEWHQQLPDGSPPVPGDAAGGTAAAAV